MSEIDNLQKADGKEEIITEMEKANSQEIVNEEITTPTPDGSNVPEEIDEVASEIEETVVTSPTEEITTPTPDESNVPEDIDKVVSEIEETVASSPTEKNLKTEEHDEVINEIEESNAEDAEDEGNSERHTIELKDYATMSMDALVIELEKLVKSEKIQAIKTHVDGLRNEFKSKFNALLEEKKAEFLNDGGNEIDFYYSSPLQKQFKDVYKEYRNKLNTHYKSLEKGLKENLTDRLVIIEELKGLINVEENINTTYKYFKELQERWRNAGPIPRDKYNNAWNSYHHHVEIFYDFLHLNRDLRDLDFKHNLDQKLKIIERAEELAQDDNTTRSFRELQVLHKMWKEELGPVPKEHRDAIWDRFKNATKTIHDKRQSYFSELDKVYEENLEKKHEIISNIEIIASESSNSHSIWQKKIKEVETLRDAFFNAGKVPIKVNEATWAKFKDAVRTFNSNKNVFYKGLKKAQFDNLQKKLELIKIAEDNKDNDDFETTTSLMKKIQSDWKSVGHVPRRDSDKIWKQFKNACNHYFDKLHATRNASNKKGLDAYNDKHKLLDELKGLDLSGDQQENLLLVKDYITKWKDVGKVATNKRYIEGKFYKALDTAFHVLKIDKNEAELIKFENKLDELKQAEDKAALDNECFFIRKRIDEATSEINQLENNLQFFSNASEENPLVKDVYTKISRQKDALEVWKTKLIKVKSLY